MDFNLHYGVTGKSRKWLRDIAINDHIHSEKILPLPFPCVKRE